MKTVVNFRILLILSIEAILFNTSRNDEVPHDDTCGDCSCMGFEKTNGKSIECDNSEDCISKIDNDNESSGPVVTSVKCKNDGAANYCYGLFEPNNSLLWIGCINELQGKETQCENKQIQGLPCPPLSEDNDVKIGGEDYTCFLRCCLGKNCNNVMGDLIPTTTTTYIDLTTTTADPTTSENTSNNMTSEETTSLSNTTSEETTSLSNTTSEKTTYLPIKKSNVQAQSGPPTGLILGIIGGILVAALLIAIAIFWVKKRKNQLNIKPESNNDVDTISMADVSIDDDTFVSANSFQ